MNDCIDPTIDAYVRNKAAIANRAYQMDGIIESYQQARAHIEHLFQGATQCPDREIARQIVHIAHAWQAETKKKLDPRSSISFDAVRSLPKIPMSWNSWHDEGSAAYNSYLRIEQQMHWLIEREERGQVMITVTGDSNRVIVGDGNTMGDN